MPIPSRFAAAALALLLLAAPAGADPAPDVVALQNAMKLVGQNDWGAAVAVSRHAGPLGQAVIEWQRLRAGKGAFADYAAFLARHPDWPGLPYLRMKGEGQIAADTPPREIVSYFAGHPPKTADGTLAYQKALRALGRKKEAADEAKRAWVEVTYSADQQAAELSDYGQTLAHLNDDRLSRLLWDGRTTEAAQMLPVVGSGARALGKARIALQTGVDKGLTDLIRAVPKSLSDDPGLAHDRFTYRYEHGKEDWAAKLMLERSQSAKMLGEPAAWAGTRARIARDEMVNGNPHTAYRIAANHHLTSGARFAELEFLSGYIALEKLHEAKLALRHFKALGDGVTTPISRSRAAYWEGRAYDALGDTKAARQAFMEGAQYQTAFYGLLSAEKVGLSLDPLLLSHAHYPDWRRAKFLQSSVLQAGLLLEKAGDRRLAKRFFLQVAEGLSATGLGQLSDLALAIGEPHYAVLIAKQAARDGVILPRAYFPVTRLAQAKLPVPNDLALAIARRESEFNVAVVSPAGAMGLMQLMPATAKKMSEAAGLTYDRGRLTEDGAYNAELGSAYLAKLIDRFGPALTLVAAGYNAGPSRASDWISQLGDPRSKDVDPVDWIESLPFTETRDYIMRVAESYEIYRSKLAGRPLRINLVAELKGSR